MTISRSRLVDTTVSRWYHCISRCVRKAHLICNEAAPGRKDWIENRLRELDAIFAVSVGGFSLMDNHLHLLLRIDPDLARGWSDTEVAERWFMLFPPRGADRKPMKVSEEIMAARLANPVWIAETRICKRRSLEVWQLSESAVGWRMSCGWYRSKTDAIEDRRERGALREGMLSGFTLGQYLMLVEYTGRMLGRFLAASRERLRQLASKLNVRHLANVG